MVHSVNLDQRCPTKLKEIGCKGASYWAFLMPTASRKTSCRHILKACRHMWRMATGLDNADLDHNTIAV